MFWNRKLMELVLDSLQLCAAELELWIVILLFFSSLKL